MYYKRRASEYSQMILNICCEVGKVAKWGKGQGGKFYGLNYILRGKVLKIKDLELS